MITVLLIDHIGRPHVDRYDCTTGWWVDERGLLWIYPPNTPRQRELAWACHREWTRFVVSIDDVVQDAR